MPVATQACIKGLTPQQTEELGITLILNNTYHLNLRPGKRVLDASGGAHAFQGWKRNMLTVSPNYTCHSNPLYTQTARRSSKLLVPQQATPSANASDLIPFRHHILTDQIFPCRIAAASRWSVFHPSVR